LKLDDEASDELEVPAGHRWRPKRRTRRALPITTTPEPSDSGAVPEEPPVSGEGGGNVNEVGISNSVNINNDDAEADDEDDDQVSMGPCWLKITVVEFEPSLLVSCNSVANWCLQAFDELNVLAAPKAAPRRILPPMPPKNATALPTNATVPLKPI